MQWILIGCGSFPNAFIRSFVKIVFSPSCWIFAQLPRIRRGWTVGRVCSGRVCHSFNWLLQLRSVRCPNRGPLRQGNPESLAWRFACRDLEHVLVPHRRGESHCLPLCSSGWYHDLEPEEHSREQTQGIIVQTVSVTTAAGPYVSIFAADDDEVGCFKEVLPHTRGASRPCVSDCACGMRNRSAADGSWSLVSELLVSCRCLLPRPPLRPQQMHKPIYAQKQTLSTARLLCPRRRCPGNSHLQILHG